MSQKEKLTKEEQSINYHSTSWLEEMKNTGKTEGIFGTAASLLAKRQRNAGKENGIT